MSRIPAAVASTPDGLARLARTELSTRARVGYVLLTLSALAMTIVVFSLWLTEPAIPLRTQVAFLIMTGIGLGWAAFGIWVLRTRRVMLARQRVVAGRLAVTFSGLFAGGSLLLALTSGVPSAWPAMAMGLVLLGVALVIWRRAEAAHAALLARRATLERELGS